MMRRAHYSEYGRPDVVRVSEVATPHAGAGEVVIRVRAATVGAADAAARAGNPAFARLFFGLRHPRLPVLGSDIAGEVAELGREVTRFQVGDRVFAATGSRMGGHASHLVMCADAAIAPAPTGVTDEETAALVDATALSFLRDTAELRAGQRLLVIGASGSVGSAAVQLGAHFGASVTGVCSTSNRELVASLGAARVIAYTAQDWRVASPDVQERYDVILDAVGASSYARARASLADGGIYLRTVPSLALLVQMAWTVAASRVGLGRTRAAIAFTGLRPTAEKARDLTVISSLVESGALRATIDSVYPLEGIAEAHRRVDSRRKRGAVIVTMTQPDEWGDSIPS